MTLPVLSCDSLINKRFLKWFKRAKARRNIGHVLYKALHTPESQMLMKLEWPMAILQPVIRHLCLCYIEKVLTVCNSTRGRVESLGGFKVLSAIPGVVTSLDIEYSLWYQMSKILVIK